MYVYLVRNRLNGKIYVGASTQEVEGSKNYFGSGVAIKNALKEFGKENFSKEILVECETVDELHEVERFWITELDSTNPLVGYNLKVVSSDGNFGKQFSDETRKKMSENHADISGVNNPNFGKDMTGVNNPFYGKHHTDSAKKKMSDAKKGSNHPFYGKQHADETRKKMSDAKKEYWRKKKSLNQS